MATREVLKNGILTSIHGRRLGFDKDEALVGPIGVKKQVIALTSANSGTTLENNGIYTIAATTLSTMVLNLPSPVPGISLTVVQGYNQNASTVVSSATYLRCQSGGTIVSSLGSTNAVTLLSSYAYVTLTGLSTAQWMCESKSASTNTYFQNAT